MASKTSIVDQSRLGMRYRPQALQHLNRRAMFNYFRAFIKQAGFSLVEHQLTNYSPGYTTIQYVKGPIRLTFRFAFHSEVGDGCFTRDTRRFIVYVSLRLPEPHTHSSHEIAFFQRMRFSDTAEDGLKAVTAMAKALHKLSKDFAQAESDKRAEANAAAGYSELTYQLGSVAADRIAVAENIQRLKQKEQDAKQTKN